MSGTVEGIERVASPQMDGRWIAGDVVSNPSANDVLASTGPLTVGDYYITWHMDSTVDTRFIVAHRNAADTADISSKEIPLAADEDYMLPIPTKIQIDPGESFEVRAKETISSGNCQVSIYCSRICG